MDFVFKTITECTASDEIKEKAYQKTTGTVRINVALRLLRATVVFVEKQ